MKLRNNYKWDPAKIFLEVAEELIESKSEQKYIALIILALTAAIEAKIKEPFYEILPDKFETISKAYFKDLFYWIFLLSINENLDFKIIKEENKDDRYKDFYKPIKIFMELRNQIAHGKFIKNETETEVSIRGNLPIKTINLVHSESYDLIIEYIKKLPEYKESIKCRQRPITNKHDIEVLLEPFVIGHFFKEAKNLFEFIDNNKEIWIKIYNDQK